MFKKICTLSVLCILLAALPALGVDIKSGKYEITATVEMPEIPVKMPPQITTQCLNEQTPVPDAGTQGCKITEMKTIGNTATYTMECNQQGMKIKSTGELTYYEDSFEGITQTSMGPTAGNLTVTTVIKGKRIGKCE